MYETKMHRYLARSSKPGLSGDTPGLICLLFHRHLSRPLPLDPAPLLLLLQAPFLCPLAHSCLLPHGQPVQCRLQEFHETFYGQFPITQLAAGGLGNDPQNSLFVDPAPEAVGDERLVFW